MAKGHTNNPNGRPKGTQNKITKELLPAYNFFLQSFGALKSGSFYVYGHSFDGDILYIGKGKNSRAWDMHNTSRNEDWAKYVEKHGNPEIVILATGLNEEEALAIESVLIKLRNPLLNNRFTQPAAQRSVFDNN